MERAQARLSFPDNLPAAWQKSLAPEKDKKYFQDLSQFLKQEYAKQVLVYPAKENILRALQETDLPDVRVVILGQDPYHGPDQAIGLSFAVPNDLKKKPPSLINIFKELSSDLNLSIDHNKSDLSGWVKQGVLLLNTVLTVRSSQAFSHRGKGWEIFSDRIIEELNKREDPMVFILWGAAAQQKKQMIDTQKHFVLESVHPSPLSAHRGFFGSKPFSKTNEILKNLGKPPINWERTSVL